MSTTAPPVEDLEVDLHLDAPTLKSVTQWVTRTLPARPPHPILSSIVIEAEGGEVAISAFDYETHARVVAPAAGAVTNGPLLVHGRTFADAVARMDGEFRITLDTDGSRDGRRVLMKDKRRSIYLYVIDPADYPRTPQSPEVAGTVDAADLIAMLGRAATVAGPTEDAGVPLHAVKLTAADGLLVALATDRYRAGEISIPWKGDDFSAIVPARRILEAVKGMSGPVALGADESHVLVRGRDRKVTIGRVASEFPPVERLLAGAPSDVGHAAHMSRAAVVDAIQTAQLAIDTGRPLTLDFGPDALTVSASGQKSDSVVDLDDVVSTTEGEIFVNAQYLLDLANAAPGPRLAIFPDPASNKKPVAVTGADDEGTPISGCRYILVPIRMQGA